MIDRTILFVCTGNTCRSPMAAALLSRELATNYRPRQSVYAVQSAGLSVSLPGGPASRNAIAVMAEMDISLAEHGVRQLDEQAVEGADLILTMTAAHKEQLAAAYPDARDRLFTLAEYVGLDRREPGVPDDGGDVHDPFGGDISEYRRCAAQLAEMIDRLTALIKSEEELTLTQSAPPHDASAIADVVLEKLGTGVGAFPEPGVAGRAVTRLAVGADHAGYLLKDQLAAAIAAQGIEIEDVGTNGPGSVDYPDFAARAAQAVASGRCQAGLLVCGTGLGMAIAANKIAGVRAVTCNDLYSARLAREHNDANLLCMGARVIAFELAREIADVFLKTPFGGGRHIMRVSKIADLEGASAQDLLGKGW